MSKVPYRPRLSVEIPEDKYNKLSRILPHGMQKPLFNVIVDGVISLYDKGGIQALGGIITSYITIEHIIDVGLNSSKEKRIAILEAKLKELKSI